MADPEPDLCVICDRPVCNAHGPHLHDGLRDAHCHRGTVVGAAACDKRRVDWRDRAKSLGGYAAAIEASRRLDEAEAYAGLILRMGKLARLGCQDDAQAAIQLVDRLKTIECGRELRVRVAEDEATRLRAALVAARDSLHDECPGGQHLRACEAASEVLAAAPVPWERGGA